MIYEYKDQVTGEVIEMIQPASESVPIGAVIERNGRLLERLFPSGVQTTMGELGIQDKYPYVGHSLTRSNPDCPKDDKGRCMVMNRQHERELEAKYDMEKT